jgi:tRNA nucleotidyltransferase (CCA-adding enzyme)
MDQSPIPLSLNCIKLFNAINKAGGTAYLVGGIVRDHLLGLPAKDFDIEVHNLPPQKLLSVLKEFGAPIAVGKSFGIWKMNIEKLQYDIALPHLNGVIEINLGLKNACRRRDLRINSMAYNPLNEQFHDPFNGMLDLKNKTLHATDPDFFIQDPLRVLRVAQIASRFQFSINQQLHSLCRIQPLCSIAPERVLVEIEKNWIKSPTPSIGITHFIQLNVIEKYFSAWPGIGEQSVLLSIDRGKQFCTNYLGWNMALFWAVALQKCTPKQAESILDTLMIFTYHSFNIREAVMCSLKFSEQLAKQDDSILRNHAAEQFRLDFLCMVSKSIFPQGVSLSNLEKAKTEGIEKKPLPKLVQGRDILILGYSGKLLGKCLQRIRIEQLHNRITTSQEAITLAKNWKEQ